VIKRLAVIGGGIIGLATAWKAARGRLAREIVLLEKEHAVGGHQSSHNSGVLHCGLYYRPGSLKAKLAVSGIREMVGFCQEHAIPHEICGKIVIAVSEEEVLRLRTLQQRGTENGLAGLRWLGPAEIQEIEPHAAGYAALHVPEEGIVDYPAVMQKMAQLLEAQGHQIRTGMKVTRVEARGAGQVVHTEGGSLEADYVINCAGLHCDRDFSLKDSWETLTFSGLYRFLKRYPGVTWNELKNSFSRKVFLRNLQRLIPEISMDDLSPHGGSGVRAQAIHRDGSLLMDFSIEQRAGQLHLLNAPSPGATASLAIGDYLLSQMTA
jgi:L-2-hydroxyglutarate oxidase LhgO